MRISANEYTIFLNFKSVKKSCTDCI